MKQESNKKKYRIIFYISFTIIITILMNTINGNQDDTRFRIASISKTMTDYGMIHTDYLFHSNEKGLLAQAYAGLGEPVDGECVIMTGAGGVITTSEDLARFAIALMKYKNEISSQMFEPQNNTEQDGAWYALGIIPRPLQDGRVVYEHNGTLTGCNAQLVIEPESGNGIVVTSNSDKAFYMTYELMESWSKIVLG